MSNGNGKERDYRADYERLHKVVLVQEEGIARVNADNQKLQEQLKLAMDINISLEKQMLQLKTINHNIMTENNEVRGQNAKEIERLRGLVKRLGGNPN